MNKGIGYSIDGNAFPGTGEHLPMMWGRMTGPKSCFFCVHYIQASDSGFADVDWAHIDPLRQCCRNIFK